MVVKLAMISRNFYWLNFLIG